MRTRLFDGEVYIKASELARQYHYTADYLGQLARQGKVKARLAGRSWYVQEASLLEYRKRDMVPPAQKPKRAVIKPEKVRNEAKSEKEAKKPAPKRTTVKKRQRTETPTGIAAPKKTHTPRKPVKELRESLEPAAAPVSVPPAPVKAGLWQKAAGWLKKLKG